MYISSQIGVRVDVNDVVYNLIGEISSSSESVAEDGDSDLEKYLITNSNDSCHQVMARTKQTERKEKDDRQQRQFSAGGQELAVGSQQRSPRFQDTDNSLDPVDVFNSVLDEGGMARKGKRSPTKRPAATGFTSDEGSTSGGSNRKRRRIESEEEEEEQTPVSPPPRKTPTKGKPGRKIIKSKALQKRPSKPRKTMSMKELCADWNRTGRVGLASETAQGWLRKTEKKREGQQRALRRARPGVRALKEIRHYQRCQTFLIPILPFQRLVREVSLNSEFAKEGLRWQSTALFSLQSSAEAYMAGYFHDVHLCALHRKVKTINRQDIWLAISIRGREHIGGKPQVSDVGACNVSGFTIADATEKKAVPKNSRTAYALEPDWCAELRQSVALDAGDGGKKGGKVQPTMKRRRRVLKNSIHCILKAAFCRLARRGGVERMSGNVFEESRGVLKVFLETIVRDAIVYANYCHRKTVTAMDVLFSLKQHGRNLYGFTRPYSYSRKVDKDLPGSKPRQ